MRKERKKKDKKKLESREKNDFILKFAFFIVGS